MKINDNSVIRPIHYLGSKLRMLEAIKSSIDFVDKTNGTICDLFSGSGVVSKYMVQYRDVISVDIQHYSSVLCEASVKKISETINIDETINAIKNSVISKQLIDNYSSLLDYERNSINKAQNDELDSLYEIIENGSLYIYINESPKNISRKLSCCLEACILNLQKNKMITSPDTMIIRYYGGLYFSYKQAMELDTIASYAFSKTGLLRTKIIAALLSTASEIVNTVGKQFAQPLKVRDSNGAWKKTLKKKILQDRSLNTYNIFREWLSYYLSIGTLNHNLISLCMDYREALRLIHNKKVKVVYADPPYTRYHYSRYYHVLETICKRDNPAVTTTFPNGQGGISRAIYREGRHQSPFCIKNQAAEAFENLFNGIYELNVPLVLSYSPYETSKASTPRLQKIDQIVDMAYKYYNHVFVQSPGEFTHSKLNSVEKNFDANHNAELLIVCY